MASDQTDLSPEEFLEKMESGAFDGNLAAEIKKLPRERLERIAHILMDRSAKQRTERRN